MNIKKIVKYPLLSILFLLLSSAFTYAQNLTITCFENKAPEFSSTSALFNLTSFMPGQKEEREIKIVNNDTKNLCSIYLKFEEIGGPSNLANAIHTNFSGGVSLAYLFSKNDNTLLATVNPNSNTAKTISLEFRKDSDDKYMDNELSFNIIVVSHWGHDSSSDDGQYTDEQVLGESDTEDSTVTIPTTSKPPKKSVISQLASLLGIEDKGEETEVEEEKEGEGIEKEKKLKDTSILGESDEEKECKERTLWWLPVLLQLLFTVVVSFSNSSLLEKKETRVLLSVLLSVVAFFAVRLIGCGCNPVWLCKYHWILNLLIIPFPLFKKTGDVRESIG